LKVLDLLFSLVRVTSSSMPGCPHIRVGANRFFWPSKAHPAGHLKSVDNLASRRRHSALPGLRFLSRAAGGG
jgi:hypothetical protein